MMTWILAIFWTVGLGVSPYFGRSKIDNKPWYKFIISLFVLIGSIGFWGNSLSATGELDWLPLSFEWPVGFAQGVVSTDEGHYIVPLTSPNRVQIYNADWTFKGGWYVDAGGGNFWIHYNNGATFEILTARGNKLYAYNLQGQLLSETTYHPESRSLRTSLGKNVYVPTIPWIFMWSHPFYSLFFGVVAIVMLKKDSVKIYLR